MSMLRCSRPVNSATSAQTAAVYISLRMCSITCDDDDTFHDVLIAHFENDVF